jgi:ABC-type amino acid transport substrate-binding protein
MNGRLPQLNCLSDFTDALQRGDELAVLCFDVLGRSHAWCYDKCSCLRLIDGHKTAKSVEENDPDTAHRWGMRVSFSIRANRACLSLCSPTGALTGTQAGLCTTRTRLLEWSDVVVSCLDWRLTMSGLSTRALSRVQVAKVATLVVLALAPCWLLAQPQATVTTEIEYVYPSESVWTTRRDAQGEPDNPLLRLAAVLFHKAQVPWHGKGYPAARMFEKLRNGTAEFSMLVKAPVLEACCVVSKRPVASTELRIYRSTKAAPVKSREDLVGKRVITILGYSYGGLLAFIEDKKNGVVNNVAETHEAAFAMLERGRADYLIDYTGPSTEVLAVRPNKSLKFEVLDQLDVYMVLSKKHPDALALMARLEAVAESLNKPEILWSPVHQ